VFYHDRLSIRGPVLEVNVNKSRIVFSLLLLSGLFALVAPLHADVLVWTLQGVTFNDGTTVTGSFDYNAASNTYTDWALVVSAASFMPAYEYLPNVDSGFVGIHSATQADFVAFPTPPPPSGRYLRLAFQNPLTDAGGTVDLAIIGSPAFECDNCANHRVITDGSVTASSSPVPEPVAFAPLSCGLLGLGIVARKLRRRG
jgi:hypothetical protein